jgi:spermidine synthase
MTEIDFEVVTEAPVGAIVALYEAGGWWKESENARSVIPRMIRGSFCFMIARNGNEIIGMGRAISDGASDAYVQDVVVLPAFRGRGIGRELVKRLTAFCVERRLEWVGLIAEPGTTAFYEGLGYRPLPGYQPMLHGKS